jgi:predicted transcriptional regulator
MSSLPKEDLLALTADIVSAHVEHNQVSTGGLPGLISKVHATLAGLGKPGEVTPAEQVPAVPIRIS